MSSSGWMWIYRHWTWLGVPAMVCSAITLGSLIRGVIAVARNAHLFRVSLVEAQQVEFAEAGTVVLSIEGPRFTRRFARVGFELADSTGQKVRSWPTLFRARTSGLSAVRMEMRAFDIPMPGRYELRMTSLGPVKETDRQHAVVFTRPHFGLSIVYIVGIVLAAAILIVSLVFFLLRLAGVRPAAG